MNSKAAMVIVALVLAMAFSSAGAAITHLQQPATATHVVLVDRSLPGGSAVCGTLSFQNRAFFRVFPDGTMSATPFFVPRRQTLVVTDVEWAAFGGPLGTNPLAQGNTLRLHIVLAMPGFGSPVFSSRGVTLDPYTVSGRPGTSEQLTAGFTVGPGTSICPYAYQEAPSSGAAAYIDYIILRGYLLP